MLRLTRPWASPLNPGAGGAALRKKRVGRDVRAHHSLLPLPAVKFVRRVGYTPRRWVCFNSLNRRLSSVGSRAGVLVSRGSAGTRAVAAKHRRDICAAAQRRARSGFQPTQPTPLARADSQPKISSSTKSEQQRTKQSEAPEHRTSMSNPTYVPPQWRACPVACVL